MRAAIRWLRENIQGSPVVLEANGLSYTEYERVSAMTGRPTILGWYTHEQLWRGNDVEDLNEKSAEVQEIYTSTEEQRVRSLLENMMCLIFLWEARSGTSMAAV